MRTDIIRGALLGILLLGFTIPGVAVAGGGDKGCSIQGTWFGVVGPLPSGDFSTQLTGWLLTVAGKSNNEGTNNLEFPNFDATLDGMVPNAVGISNLRGVWKRTGGNTFDYMFMGYAVDADNSPLYIAKISGHVTLFNDCQNEHITAHMELYLPDVSPFDGNWFYEDDLDDHYSQRFTMD